MRNATNVTELFVVKNNLPGIMNHMKSYTTSSSALNDKILTNTILVKTSV